MASNSFRTHVDTAIAAFRRRRRRVLDRIRWFADRWFDFRHGTNTSGVTQLESAGAVSDSVSHGVFYEPSPTGLFINLLGRIQLDHRRFSFIDLGSGKGRALLLAARWPFRKIVGVELCTQFHETAQANIAAFRGHRRCSDVSSHNADVLSFDWPPGDLLIYMFNPFDETILAAVLRRIEEAITREPRVVVLLYCHPKHASLIETSSAGWHKAEIVMPPIRTRRPGNISGTRVYCNRALGNEVTIAA